MRVAVLHNHVAENATADDRDVLVQAECVTAALSRQGHQAASLAATLDLDELAQKLKHQAPDLVFYLVESLGGSDRLAPAAAALVEVLGIPHTGSPADGLWLSSHKLLAKDRLIAAGLPTPAWATTDESGIGPNAGTGRAPGPLAPPYILKTVFEHASFAMDDASVVRDNLHGSVAEQLARHYQRWQRAVFAEQFIAGREFNLSLLADGCSAEVLPVAEIDFSAFPADRPRIVGYAAKWDAASFEYNATPRRYDFPPEDRPLVQRLVELATTTWDVFGLAGYVRVDFRVDDRGQPWILEVNSNPCLSPDAGFAAALAQAGLSLDDAVARIVGAAV